MYDGDKKYRKDSIKICSDFGYPDEVRQKVERARTEMEIERILVSAREKYLSDPNYIWRRKREVQRERRKKIPA